MVLWDDEVSWHKPILSYIQIKGLVRKREPSLYDNLKVAFTYSLNAYLCNTPLTFDTMASQACLGEFYKLIYNFGLALSMMDALNAMFSNNKCDSMFLNKKCDSKCSLRCDE